MNAREIKRLAKKAIAGVNKFLKKNPKRRHCEVGAWYGETITARRGHVAEDVNASAAAAIRRLPPAKR